MGNTSLQDGSIELYDKGNLNIAQNLTAHNGEIVATKNSKLNVGGDLNVSQDKDETVWNKIEDGSSLTVGGDFKLSGLYREGEGDFSTSASGDYYHRLDFYSTGEGSTLTVKGDTFVSDNAHLFAETYSNPTDNPDHEKYIDKSTFNDIGRAEFEGDVNLSRNGKLAAYNAGEVTIDGNVNAESGSTIAAFYSDAAVTVKGNAKLSDANSKIEAGNTGSIKIMGNTDVVNGEIGIENKATLSIDGNTSVVGAGTLFVENNSTATFGGDLTINESKFDVKGNSTATVDGNLTLNNVEDSNVWNKVVGGSSMTVNGDLNMKGHYREGYYTEDTDIEFFRNAFIIGENGGASTALIKGDVNLTDNSHFMTQTYNHSQTDHTTYHPRDDFEKLSSTTIEGNLNVERNSRLGAYSASDTVVKGNATVTSGGTIEAWNSDALLTINGDVSVSDENSEIGMGRTADIDIGGNLNVKNNAKTYIGEGSSLTVAKSLTSEDSLLEGYQGKLNVGGDLTINNNTDKEIWNKLDSNSALTVNGDLNMKGNFKEGVYDENNEDGYFKNNFFISGAGNSVGSTALIKGDVHLSDNSHFFTETYSQPAPDHSTYHSRDEFEKLSATTIEGNVTVDSNSRLGAYSASDTFVDGNVDITSGGSIEAWNSDAYLNIAGDVLVTDENSQVGLGRTGNIDIGGKLTAQVLQFKIS